MFRSMFEKVNEKELLNKNDREALKKLDNPDFPDIAEDGKGYFIVWADGRGIVAYKNKKDAWAFINQGGRDVTSLQYRKREKDTAKKKDAKVRTSFSPDPDKGY